MRTAIFALTPPAAALARRLAACMEGAALFFSARLGVQEGAVQFARLSPAVQAAFSRYDALVFVMAAGIVVRTIAPLVKSKLSDPAVLVFDERGRHGISLLSGHVGGANALTRRLSAAIGADSVITTATDVAGLIAPDALAAELGLRPAPKAMIETINSALLAGDAIGYTIEAGLSHEVFYREQLAQRGIAVQGAEEAPPCALRVVLGSEARGAAGTLYLVPRRLIAGLGCRRSTTAEEIQAALFAACRRIDVPVSRVDALASTTAKEEEQGLLAAARSLAREIHFYGNAPMQEQIERHDLMESSFVRQTIGIGNVCEAAALCCAGARGGRFALCKTKFEKVTVALVWEN